MITKKGNFRKLPLKKYYKKLCKCSVFLESLKVFSYICTFYKVSNEQQFKKISMNVKKIMMCAASLAAGLALLSACGGDEPVITPKLDVTPATVNATSAGGASTVTVTANVAWTAVSDSSWATVSDKTDIGFMINVAANRTAEARTATVTVSGDGVSKTVTVAQADIKLSLTPTVVNVAAGGGTKIIAVTPDVDWTVESNQPWANVASNSSNDTVIVTVDANDAAERSATITVSAGGKTATATVVQAGKAVKPELWQPLIIPPTYSKTGMFLDISADATGESWAGGWYLHDYITYDLTVAEAGTVVVTSTEGDLLFRAFTDKEAATPAPDKTGGQQGDPNMTFTAVPDTHYYVIIISYKYWESGQKEEGYLAEDIEVGFEISLTTLSD